ncbi:MAG: HAMP domain-containing methyl-accepting chemotaxis protein [Marinomonas sp.]
MRVTVVQKTVIGFIILLLLMLSQAVVSFMNQASLLSQQAFQLDSLMPISNNINQLSKQLLQANKLTMQHLSTTEAAQRESIQTDFEEIRNQFSQTQTLLEQQLIDYPELEEQLALALPASEQTFSLGLMLQNDNNLKSSQGAALVSALENFKEEWEFYNSDVEELTLDLSPDEALSDRFSFQFMDQINSEFVGDINITLAISDKFEYERVLALQTDRYAAMLNTLKELGSYRNIILDRMQFYIDFMDFTLKDPDGVYAKLAPVIAQQNRSVNLQKSLAEQVNLADIHFSQLSKAIKNLSQQTYESTVSSNQNYSQIQTIFLVISFSAALFIGFSTVNSIRRPLSLIMKNLAKMTQGDLTNNIHLNKTDEFGQIATQINTLRNKLIDIIQQLANVSEEVAGVSQETSSNNQKTDKQISYQHQETNDMKRSIEELHNCASQVANHAQTSNQEVQHLHKLAQANSQSINNNKLSADRMGIEMQQANQSIASLVKEIAGIGDIVSSIQDITSQTNLLALNASIEAARAGEHGRGFSVVADEVRTLASSTQTATHDIESIVEQLKQSADQVLKAMATSQSETESMANIAEQINASYSELSEAINAVNASNQSISEAVQVQNTQVDSINENIQRIVTVADDIAQSSKANNQHSQDLESLASKQKSLVNAFKL